MIAKKITAKNAISFNYYIGINNHVKSISAWPHLQTRKKMMKGFN